MFTMPVPAHAPTRSTLVMFSGGVDSTYLLVKLLRETDDEVLAHHIHFFNAEGRAQVEADRSRAIIAWLQRNVRAFAYTESALDHRGLRWFGSDIMASGFEAGLVANSYRMTTGRHLDRFVHGYCTDEASQRDLFGRAMAHACCAANCFPHPAPEFWKAPAVSKAEELAALPEPVRKLVWTCRWPVPQPGGFGECGRCLTCRTMAIARVQLAASNAPDGYRTPSFDPPLDAPDYGSAELRQW